MEDANNMLQSQLEYSQLTAYKSDAADRACCSVVVPPKLIIINNYIIYYIQTGNIIRIY